MGLPVNDLLSSNVDILKSRASRLAMQGVFIAISAVIVATLAVTYADTQAVSLDGIMHAQRDNFVLWILDGMPFVFGYLGQYTSHIMAQEANQLVMQQTDELRQRASALEKQATFAATHDSVTELPNRALFYDRLDRAIRSASAQDTTLAALLLSIDNLKEIQDTLGPANADLILKQIAARLAGWSTSQDSVAHIDSHSFAILLAEGSDKAAAETAARHLIKALEPHFVIRQLKLTLHPSIGIVQFPEHGEDADTLLQRAGVAVYVAGKSVSGYALYSPSLDEHSPRRLTLMGELKRALERDELLLHYQPKLDISGRSVIGAEALVRWQHPQHGFIPPDEFIGMAERTRMIRPLTQWVIERAFLDCAIWRQRGLTHTVSINLSAKDLHDPELPDLVAGILAKANIRPEWIVFEITESSIMTDPARVLIILERLKSMGFTLAIDDFGTGYSSLAYLKKLPVSELKIDKSFVMDMLASENDAVIVRATVDLAHNLGLKVTAEGVESAPALATLQAYGCDIAQGYLFSKPLTAEDFEAWLQDRRP